MDLAWEIAPGEIFAAFHAYLAEGKIAATRCPSCNQVYLPPRAVCGDCYLPLRDWVEVGGSGIVEALTISHHPILDTVTGKMRATPYVSLLVKLDGASTSVNHYLDADSRAAVIGARVDAVWREPRRTMADLIGFGIARGVAVEVFPRPLPPRSVAPPPRAPVRLDIPFSYAAGRGASWFFEGFKRGEILGSRCPSCDRIRVPSRSFCPACFYTLGESDLRPVGPHGTIVATAGPPSQRLGLIRMDGADNDLLHKVEAARGDRVKARFLPADRCRGDIRDIECFERTGP